MNSKRILVIGAGASIQECYESGNYPDDYEKIFPSLKNFCQKLFNPLSDILSLGTALYLDEKKIYYEKKFLNRGVDTEISPNEIDNSPVMRFIKKEKEDFENYNIEKLCEFLWEKFYSDNNFWDSFIYDGIYFYLFYLHTEQFGWGIDKQLNASRKLISKLNDNDLIINLNYDIVFDLALVQNKRKFCYLPQILENHILVMKPHGSMNLLVNTKSGDCYFEAPHKIKGNVLLKDNNGEIFSPYAGILPPRLNKKYKQHQIAASIIYSYKDFECEKLTFWGTGLAQSDIELLSIYKSATKNARIIEFINPNKEDGNKAEKILGRKINYFPSLEEWMINN